MGKTIIRVACIDQKLVLISDPGIASGGRNEDVVEFEFCSLWSGFAKTAVFYRTPDEVHHVLVIGDSCVIPHEVLADDGPMYFGVFGVKGDTTRTSEIIKYRVAKGALIPGSEPSDPAPNIYEQIMEHVGEIDNRTTALEEFLTQPMHYTLSGGVVQLENFEGMPMDCEIHIDPAQPGSGAPARDNIRPISARNSVRLTRSGKNLVNMGSMYTVLSTAAVTHGKDSIRIYATDPTAYCAARTQNMMLYKGVQYTLSATVDRIDSGTVRLGFRRTKGGTFVTGSNIQFPAPAAKAVTFTLDEDVEAYLAAMVTWDTEAIGDATFSDIQLEFGPAATEYEAYVGTDATIPLGESIYGGTLDTSTGLLTIDRALRTYDADTYNWQVSSVTTHDRYLNLISDSLPNSQIVCSHAHSDSALKALGGAFINQNGAFCWNFAEYGTTTLDDFKAYLTAQASEGAPVQVCYYLATPVTLEVTPQQITALAGTNAIMSNAGAVTVSGRKDVYWLTHNLVERIKALEEVVATLSTANERS